MSKLINVVFGKYNWIGINVTIINSSVDDFSYIAEGSVICETKIGKFCSIGPNVRIAPGKHPTHTFASTHPSIYSNPYNLLKNFSKEDIFEYKKDVVIGNDVWIGANAIILNGVKIGDGAIIGANTVVTSDVESYAIVVGSPSKLVKHRFSEEEIDYLLKLKWWDKSHEWIQLNSENLCDIKKLINLNPLL
ncbi:CatB-related O-acetyltransferase [Chryseobacterium geocarposphaerae]|nr:CatB-related O-acetyltransferase [Chryseobacterium geocarposphaerae]